MSFRFFVFFSFIVFGGKNVLAVTVERENKVLVMERGHWKKRNDHNKPLHSISSERSPSVGQWETRINGWRQWGNRVYIINDLEICEGVEDWVGWGVLRRQNFTMERTTNPSSMKPVQVLVMIAFRKCDAKSEEEWSSLLLRGNIKGTHQIAIVAFSHVFAFDWSIVIHTYRAHCYEEWELSMGDFLVFPIFACHMWEVILSLRERRERLLQDWFEIEYPLIPWLRSRLNECPSSSPSLVQALHHPPLDFDCQTTLSIL